MRGNQKNSTDGKKDTKEQNVTKDAVKQIEAEMTVVEEAPDPLVNPFWRMEKAFEKKLRNLKKRELRLFQMKEAAEGSNKELTDEQHDAFSKLDEVKLQISFVEEMMKLNVQQQSLYKKAVKQRERQLKLEQKAQLQRTISQPKNEEKDKEMLDKRGEKGQLHPADGHQQKIVEEDLKKEELGDAKKVVPAEGEQKKANLEGDKGSQPSKIAETKSNEKANYDGNRADGDGWTTNNDKKENHDPWVASAGAWAS